MQAQADSRHHPIRVYIGTYTGPKSQGIYYAQFDADTGELSSPELAVGTASPSFLAVHPSNRFLYAVGETGNLRGKGMGSVSAFGIDPQSGRLRLLNECSSGGGGPCHLALDRRGECVLVANYGSGAIAVLPVQRDGLLAEASAIIQHSGSSVDPQRQTGPHAHYITADPGNRFALACDLGLDQVLVYGLDAAKGTLQPHTPAFVPIRAGSGPRHLVFHPSGRYVYLINEMAATLTGFAYDAKTGRLQELQTVSTLPLGYTGAKSCAEVQIHPSGRFLYGSNRGLDSIAIFAVDSRSGKLTPLGYESTLGKTPRHFAIDPTGKWLLAENQDSDSIVVFRLDPKSGRLTPAGQSVAVPCPVCAVFVPMK